MTSLSATIMVLSMIMCTIIVGFDIITAVTGVPTPGSVSNHRTISIRVSISSSASGGSRIRSMRLSTAMCFSRRRRSCCVRGRPSISGGGGGGSSTFISITNIIIIIIAVCVCSVYSAPASSYDALLLSHARGP